MSIFYLRVCNDGGCEVYFYKFIVNIFFNGMFNFFISFMLWFFSYCIFDINIDFKSN